VPSGRYHPYELKKNLHKTTETERICHPRLLGIHQFWVVPVEIELVPGFVLLPSPQFENSESEFFGESDRYRTRQSCYEFGTIILTQFID